MKKLIIFVVLVVLAAVLIKYSGTKVAPAPSTTAYTGTTFSFEPASGYPVTTTDENTLWRTNTQTAGQLLAKVHIPREFQPQTNFSEATFTIGMSTDYDAVRECIVPSNGERAKGSVEINGTTFYIITLSDAGMSNYYDTTSYRTLHNDSCYAVEYTIHSTSFAAYDPSLGIKEFDTPAVVKVLEDMVQSFKFI